MIADKLTKLFVGSGGRGRSVDLGDGWRIGMFEGERGDAEHPFVLTLTTPKGKTARWALRRQDVCTKGRSPWQRDNAWRLTSGTVLVVSAAIETLMQDPRAREP